MSIFRKLTGTTSDEFKIGRGNDTTKTLTANTGAANPPKLRFNSDTDVWEYSNDGTNYLPFRSYNVRQVTTNATAARGDFIEADTTSGNIVITLPDFQTTDQGATIDVVKTTDDVNTVTFSQNVNGGSLTLDTGWETANLIWTGTRYITRVY